MNAKEWINPELATSALRTSNDPSEIKRELLHKLRDQLERIFKERACEYGIAQQKKFCIHDSNFQIFTAGFNPEAYLAPITHNPPVTTNIKELAVFIFDLHSAEWPFQISELLASQTHTKQEKNSQYIYRAQRFRLLWNSWEPIAELILIDTEESKAFVCLKHLDTAQHTIKVPSPLRNLISLWFEEQSSIMLHAAAVGSNTGCLLICGNNGAGKSSTALTCLNTELQYMGDDSILVSLTDPIEAHQVYLSGSLNQHDLIRYPSLTQIERQQRNSTEKVDFILNDKPEWLITRSPLKALIINRIARDEVCSLKKSTPGSALATLAPSSITRNPSQLEESFRQIKEIALSLPCYQLTIGADYQRIPEIFTTLLRSLT